MDKIVSLIILKSEFEFNGSQEELTEKINSNKKINFEWFNDNEFKFLSKFSIGTLMVTGFNQYIDGIMGYAKLTELDSDRTKVELKTKVRIELYIFVGFITLFYIIFSVSGEDFFDLKPWYLPLILIWFWFVYRVQEKILFYMFKKHLGK
ncbi:hypothetical protein [Aquimarina sp. AU58]|uniref:hypothetical protein n=1 Tax=Aquimarina sp. AU58 TaxID=1874112 RepID=UPI000D6E94D9|nr:hypothetical protein [Aquimarina sp. AU58]